MWDAQIQTLDADRIQKIRITRNEDPARYSGVVQAWQDEEEFRSFFISLIAKAPFQAFYWETPPVSSATFDQEFEFVLVDSSQLRDVRADPLTFASYFESSDVDDDIVTFWNLGKDALLVVPCPLDAASAYAHLGDFTRNSPLEQQHALWKSVGMAVDEQLGEQPLWLSTAGTGIFWLHVRLDSRPKYYTYQPYRESTPVK